MKKNEKTNQKDNREIRIPPAKIAKVLPIQGKEYIKSDIDGSYTGMNIMNDKPVQDVDDL